MHLTWRPQMAIDHDVLDQEHQTLLAIANEFYGLPQNAADKSDLLKILAKLRSYAIEHFTREENLQNSMFYPLREQHHAEHQDLLRRMEALDQVLLGLGQMPSAVADERDIIWIETDFVCKLQDAYRAFALLIRDWVVEHFIKSDLQMRPYVQPIAREKKGMHSLWAAKPVLLTSNGGVGADFNAAFVSDKGWRPASFSDPKKLRASYRNGDEYKTLNQMHADAKDLDLVGLVDPGCSHFRSPILEAGLKLWRSKSRSGGIPARQDLSPHFHDFLHNLALFECIGVPNGKHRYKARLTGPLFANTFSEMSGRLIDEFVPPQYLKRWYLVLNSVLAYRAPLRIIGLIEASSDGPVICEFLFAPALNDVGKPLMVIVIVDRIEEKSWSAIEPEERAYMDRLAGVTRTENTVTARQT